MAMNETELKISGICDEIKELLINKNRKYGLLSEKKAEDEP